MIYIFGVLSTIEAFLLQTGHPRARDVGRALREALVPRVV
jgi:hypothetical protein